MSRTSQPPRRALYEIEQEQPLTAETTESPQGPETGAFFVPGFFIPKDAA